MSKRFGFALSLGATLAATVAMAPPAKAATYVTLSVDSICVLPAYTLSCKDTLVATHPWRLRLDVHNGGPDTCRSWYVEAALHLPVTDSLWTVYFYDEPINPGLSRRFYLTGPYVSPIDDGPGHIGIYIAPLDPPDDPYTDDNFGERDFEVTMPTGPFTGLPIAAEGFWFDYDDDGDLDVWGTNLYRNDGGEGLIDLGTNPAPLGQLIDYDHDGDLDVLYNRIYRNEGDWSFTDQGAPSIREYAFTSLLSWVDIDNDTDMDLLVGGCTGSNGWDWLVEMYQSVGNSLYSYRTFNDGNVGCLKSGYGDPSPSVRWGDYDNDGRVDLSMVDEYDAYRSYPEARIFWGSGAFSKLKSVTRGSTTWGDYDNDGDLDVLLTGLAVDVVPNHVVTILYRNDGSRTFSDVGAPLTAVRYGWGAWGDYDNDGDVDFLLRGWDANDMVVGKVYRNEGGGDFSDIAALPGVYAWGDYDNDGDLDILGGGTIYRNESSAVNTPPSAPSGLVAVQDSLGRTTFSWNASSDGETPSPGLTYSLRVGTTPGGNERLFPWASAGGYRLKPGFGNVEHNTSWRLRLPLGTYYWSVQAVDGGFMGSPFAPEQTIDVVSTATSLSLVSTQAEPDRVRLTWYAADASALEATLYRRTPESPWRALELVHADGSGTISYEDTEVVAGTRYGYRLGVLEDGQEVFLGETWVEVPVAARWALEGLRPNPSSANLTVAFSLPVAAPARLDLMDLAGRRIMSRQVSGLGAGNHVVRLRPDQSLAPGVYLLRLTQGGRSLVARGVIVR